MNERMQGKKENWRKGRESSQGDATAGADPRRNYMSQTGDRARSGNEFELVEEAPDGGF